MLQVVCAGVYLLTPSKRAYLRYYKDLEDDILGRRGHPVADIEARLSTPIDRKYAEHLAASGGLPFEAEEVSSPALLCSPHEGSMELLPDS